MGTKSKEKTTVVVQKIKYGIKDAFQEALSQFGGAGKVFPHEKAVWVKPNAVHYGPEQYTSTEFLDALFSLLSDHGVKNIYLTDNCTGGNFTRLVFHATGYLELCKKYNAEPVMLDEEPTVPVTLAKEGRPIQFAKRLYRAWIQEREANVYLAAPKFKTHSMSTVTLAVKGQQGLLQDADKMYSHNFNLHRRLARIYKLVRPDFVLIDAQKIVFYGHFPARTMLDRSTEELGLVLAGEDALAVDVVGAKIMGYGIEDVEHLRLVHKDGSGQGDIGRIEIIGDLSPYTKRYPSDILGIFPEGFKRIYGKERACREGCVGNAEAGVEYLYNEAGGNGRFNLVCGKGFEASMLDGLDGDFLIAGPCAVLEVADIIRRKYPKAKVYTVPEHNDLARTTGIIARLLKPNIMKISPVSPLTTARLLFQAYRKGLKSRIARPW